MNAPLVPMGLAAVLLVVSPGCRKRSAAPPVAPSPPPPAPAVAGDPASAPPRSVYDSGAVGDRTAGAKDRLFKRWATMYARGTPADKTKAKAEIASQPAETRAEFEKFCQANGVKLD